MVRVRDAHFFRKVPRDVSEATKLGGVISVLGVLTICWLVREEVADFMTLKRTTQLRLSSTARLLESQGPGNDEIRINLNITMKHLPCQYAALQVADHVGSHKLDGHRNIHRLRLSADGSSLGMYQPHKYEHGEKAKGHMSEHVFPWHKEQHAQGDKDHIEAVKMTHLSEEQQKVVRKVDEDMRHSTAKKGAQLGRRLLSVEEARPADLNSMCKAWAANNECATNSAYMLKNCYVSCGAVASASVCAQWKEQHRCEDSGEFMREFCIGSCAPRTPPPSAPAIELEQKEGGGEGAVAAAEGDAPSAQNEQAPQLAGAQPAEAKPIEAGAQLETKAEAKEEAKVEASLPAGAEARPATAEAAEETFVPSEPFNRMPASMELAGFTQMIQDHPLVFVNYFAPWCFWSNKLTPAWLEVAARLHTRAYSQSVKFVQVDCTEPKGKALCMSQSVHAFPSVRIYRGSIRAFEAYEYGREANVLWLHLVKLTAEVVVAKMQELPPEERKKYTLQISHISNDLKVVMERREQGLDEDWSEDALSAEEEVQEDRELLAQIDAAVRSITGAKGVRHDEVARVMGAVGVGLEDAESHALTEKSADVVLGLLNSAANQPGAAEAGGGEAAEPWPEQETHEGCQIFGYIDVSRAPGTLHVAPHSGRHSFDFSSVNTSHHIDHLSFGLELSLVERSLLPESVRASLTTLDGKHFVSTQPHETQEHHINIMPTSVHVSTSMTQRVLETFQFTATSHARTRDTLPSLIISYDVSPIQAHIKEHHKPWSDFIVSLCAIVGGAFSLFGIIDGLIFTSAVEIKKTLGKQY
ncbi:hypothetical protein AB1Y20_018118 [Prymnesium parvum]|uniref:Thioredoxin domain-containing protein n=1 Tax=Prymnesium parvum TaxID=97485 RepID=A0AB34JR06_PRYPA